MMSPFRPSAVFGGDAPDVPLTVNFHLGVPEIYPTLIRKTAASLAEKMQARSSVFVSAQSYRADIRPDLIEPSFVMANGSTAARLRSLSYVPETTQTIAFSQHKSLTGASEETDTSAPPAATASVLPTLENYFAGVDLHLHVVAVCQHDYGPLIDNRSVADPCVSWAALVADVAAHVPSAHIHVWATEDPQTIAIPFVIGMLGLAPEDLTVADREHILTQAAGQRFGAPKEVMPSPFEEVSLRLDMLYETDLQKLERMPRVHLVRSDHMRASA